MFSRILHKYASEAGYPENISRCLLTSLQELPLIPFAPCFLWSTSHNVKESDTCPFAISPHLKPLFPLSHKCNEICEKSALLVSAFLPFPVFPSPTCCPSLPQHSPFPLHSVCFEPLCALRLESELCINLFGPFICTRPTLHFRQAWSVQDLLVRLPWGGYLVFEAICLGIKKNPPSLGDREAGRVILSHRGKEWGRKAEIGSLLFYIYFRIFNVKKSILF